MSAARWRLAALLALGMVALGIGGSGIQSSVARALGLSDGTVLTVGAVTDGQALVRSGSTVTSSAVQASDTELTCLAGTTSAADKVPYYTGSGTCSTATLTSTGRSVIDDASAAALRDTVIWASAASIACSSPCTPGAGIDRVTISGTTTINLPTLSGLADGQTVTAVCNSASTCTVTLDPSDSGTCDGGSAGAACSAITVAPHGTVGAIRTSSSAWGSVQPGALSTGWRAIKMSVISGVLSCQEYAQSGAGALAVGSVVTATVETGSSAEVAFSGSDATIKAGIGTGGGSAIYSSPYEAYCAISSFSSTLQALVASGQIATLQVGMTSMDTGVTTSQWGVAVTGGISGAFSAPGEVYTNAGFRQGVTAHSARARSDTANGVNNMPATGAKAWFPFIIGLGTSTSTPAMFANSTTGSSTCPGNTGGTAPTTADQLEFFASGVTSSPLVDVAVTAPYAWLILGGGA